MTQFRKFLKNSKKIQKTRKHHSRFISSQTGAGKAKKEKKKISFRISPYTTRFRKFKNNCKKIQKIINHYSGFISSQTGMGKAKKKKEEKKFVPNPSLHNPV